MTRVRQLALDLASRPARARKDFYITQSNRMALAQIDTWPNWPEGRMALIGPPGSGKTHLTNVWANRSEAQILRVVDLERFDPSALPTGAAVAVEDADLLPQLSSVGAAEEMLFHLCNRLHSQGGTLLVSGVEAPAHWPIRLPDLASRLGTAGVARLDAPDDELLSAVLMKLFADRQLEVSGEIIDFLLLRMERSFAAAEEVVGSLNRATIATRRSITPRLVREVLDRFEESHEVT
ncbi:MAG: DnaA/Hda family protein [Pseudomonadota bacterium]